MKSNIIEALNKSINKLNVEIDIELTPSKGHGDFSTNVAMKLAGKLKESPQVLAQKIIDNLDGSFIEKTEIAGPGFINIFLKNDSINSIVGDIIKNGDDFGKGSQGKYINVEYVSANPTGYLHLGHARGAAVGSALVNTLRFAGNKVDAEYYINDAGNQIDILGMSAYTRYQNELGNNIELPEDSYKGEDIIDIAKLLIKEVGNKYLNVSYDDSKDFFKNESKKLLLISIKEHLSKYGVKFDLFSSEEDLYKQDKIKPALESLKKHIFEKDGATWLNTTVEGDNKDRVLIKKDGAYTYLTPDIAYHKIKLDRKYDELINIWGADHIGYIKRMKVALRYLGLPNDKLDILTIQLVKLFKDGEEVKMSKRKGTVYSLIDLVNEVGIDAARWFMLDRAINSEFIFDLNKALEKSNENPAFFVQYSHARANQLMEKLDSKKQDGEYSTKEVQLIQEIAKFPDVISQIANNHKVNVLPQYLLNVAKLFNSWYSNSKAIGATNEGMLKDLVTAVKIVLKNGLNVIGVNAPNNM